MRRKCLALMLDYGARVRLVHVEAPEPVLRHRNRARAVPVPDDVIDRMLSRWQVPDPSEAHRVEWFAPAAPSEAESDGTVSVGWW